MSQISYHIEVIGNGDEDYIQLTAKTDTGARRQTKKFLHTFEYDGRQVFLAFRNQDQGFTGYLNSDGSVSATGKSWNRADWK